MIEIVCKRVCICASTWDREREIVCLCVCVYVKERDT